MLLIKEFTFDAAHSLPNVPEGHKCRNVHGHTYRLRIVIKGELDPELGWVMDFADLKKVWKPLELRLDHQYLNDIEGLANPTAEMIVKWIWDKLKPELPGLDRLELFETPSAGVVYEGD